MRRRPSKEASPVGWVFGAAQRRSGESARDSRLHLAGIFRTASAATERSFLLVLLLVILLVIEAVDHEQEHDREIVTM